MRKTLICLVLGFGLALLATSTFATGKEVAAPTVDEVETSVVAEVNETEVASVPAGATCGDNTFTQTLKFLAPADQALACTFGECKLDAQCSCDGGFCSNGCCVCPL